jgi:hypothetical protein
MSAPTNLDDYRARAHREPRKARDQLTVTREAADAARALAVTTSAWLAILPRPAAVDNARSTVAGLSRLLAELAALQGGDHDRIA